MQRPPQSPIAPEDWDEAWKGFARTWAYGRLEQGPSWGAEAAAIKEFSGERRHIAAWVITQARWHENGDVLEFRNTIEARINRSDESLCDRDAVRVKVTKSMLDLMQSAFVDPKDRVGAGKLLSDIYGLVEKNPDEDANKLPAGAMLIAMPSVDDFARMAFQQQQDLERTIEGRLIDLKTEHGE